MMIAVFLAAIVACVLFSAFFSASEMSFSSCNRMRLEHARDEGDNKAAAALRITERFDDTLSTILVGNNLVNIAASSLASVLVLLAFDGKHTWVATTLLTIIIIIFGETIPKITAKKNATRMAMQCAKPIRVLMILFRPVTFVVVMLVKLITMPLKGETKDDDDDAVEELHSIIETAEDEEVIDEDASELVNAAIDFSEISASEIMTARVDMVSIDIEDEWDNIIHVIGTSRYSRIPVYQGSRDNIIGILNLKHFLKSMIDDKHVDIRAQMLPPCYVYKTMKLPAVLSAMRTAKQHLAVVTDEYGGTLGVVSMEDVLEELVGDIWDETDMVEEEISEAEDGTVEMDGDVTVSELMEMMGWNEEQYTFESETVGGWCIEVLGEFPRKDQMFVFENAVVTVLEVGERRVRRVRIVRKEAAPSDKE